MLTQEDRVYARHSLDAQFLTQTLCKPKAGVCRIMWGIRHSNLTSRSIRMASLDGHLWALLAETLVYRNSFSVLCLLGDVGSEGWILYKAPWLVSLHWNHVLNKTTRKGLSEAWSYSVCGVCGETGEDSLVKNLHASELRCACHGPPWEGSPQAVHHCRTWSQLSPDRADKIVDSRIRFYLHQSSYMDWPYLHTRSPFKNPWPMLFEFSKGKP